MTIKYDEHPDTITNNDGLFHPESDPIDVCDYVAKMMIERGYPVGTDDIYTLSKKIYERNYGNKNH